MKKWDRHNELVETIEELGYTVSDLFLNSADFGCAQARKRMFLVCDKQGSRVSREQLLAMGPGSSQTAHDVIDWNVNHVSRPLRKSGRAKATIERAERAIASIGKNTPFIIVYYGSDYAGGWQTLDVPLRTVTTVDRFGVSYHAILIRKEAGLSRKGDQPERLRDLSGATWSDMRGNDRQDPALASS
jgi:DNA (cytosine-5)-methyltransferase 1